VATAVLTACLAGLTTGCASECALVPTETDPVVFVGVVDANAGGIVTFAPREVRAGALAEGTVAVAYVDADLEFLEVGRSYLVSATPNALGLLESSVNSECGEVTTRYADGSTIDTGVFRNVSPLRWGLIALAPVGALFILLASLDGLVRWIRRRRRRRREARAQARASS
jgi:hypothetical protein